MAVRLIPLQSQSPSPALMTTTSPPSATPTTLRTPLQKTQQLELRLASQPKQPILIAVPTSPTTLPPTPVSSLPLIQQQA